MQVISPKLGEFLIKVTGSNDIDSAFHKVFNDYLELKLKNLQEKSDQFQKKWGMNFMTFKKKLKTSTLGKDEYSFDVENDFWQWEEAETLKKHYKALKQKWI